MDKAVIDLGKSGSIAGLIFAEHLMDLLIEPMPFERLSTSKLGEKLPFSFGYERKFAKLSHGRHYASTGVGRDECTCLC